MIINGHLPHAADRPRGDTFLPRRGAPVWPKRNPPPPTLFETLAIVAIVVTGCLGVLAVLS